MVCLDQETGQKDPAVLTTLRQITGQVSSIFRFPGAFNGILGFQLKFGVYLSILPEQEGKLLHVNDPLHVLEHKNG